MDINISVDGETAYLLESASIVCGNSNYVLRITFDTDWSAYTSKTAVFRYFSSGSFKKKSVLFQGNSVNVPALPTTNQVSVVFYAGDLHTTTPAIIPCIGETEQHDPPTPDVYNQLMELLAGMQGGGAKIGTQIPQTIGFDDSEIGIAVREE